MARVVVIDAGPLGLASRARGKPDVDHCRDWIRALDWAGSLVVAPEIADFEVRRELIRTAAAAGLRRLDRLIGDLLYAPITTTAMRRAADLWASVRRNGLPTAGPRSLDADCILAAQALSICGAGDTLTIATGNPGHLARFGVDAREWNRIVP